MKIPTVVPHTQGQAKVTVKNIMADFHRQMGDNFPKFIFEAFSYYCLAKFVLLVATIDILYTLDSASLLVKLKPRIFQRLPPFE